MRTTTTAFLLVGLLALGAGCGSGGSALPDLSADQGTGASSNLPPFFQGVQGVLTAGDARILVKWEAATDDTDTSSSIRYRIFVSSTSDGHNFAAPTLTTGAGVTRVQLTSANSTALAVGSECFVVVRAFDSEGAEDPNRVECAVTCVDPSQIAYLDPGFMSEGGTLGDPTDPFDNFGDAVDAIPASGGIIVAAGGTISNDWSITDSGDSGSIFGLYGSFDSSDFVSGVTPQTLLAGNDLENNPTVFDIDGSSDSSLFVRNHGRRTYIGACVFQNDAFSNLLQGEHVNLVVNCCRFRDSDPETEPAPTRGIFIREPEPNGLANNWSLDVVGCGFDRVDPFGAPDFTCINVGGRMDRLRVGSSRAVDCGTFLESFVLVPPGVDWDCRFETNWLARLAGEHGFRISMFQGPSDGEGDVDIHVVGNRLAGIQGSNVIREFGGHGEGGTVNIACERNYFGAIGEHGLRIECLDGFTEATQTLAATTTNISYRNNDAGNVGEEALLLQNFNPPADGEANLTVKDCGFIEIDNQCVDLEFLGENGPNPPFNPPFSQLNAELDADLSDLDALGVVGLLEWDHGVFRSGSMTLDIADCFVDAVGGGDEEVGTKDAINIDVFGIMERNSEGPDEGTVAVRIEDCTIATAEDERSDGIDISFQPVAVPGTVCQIRRNEILTPEQGIDTNFEFVPDATLFLDIEGNQMLGADFVNEDDEEEGDSVGMIQVDIEAETTRSTAYMNVCNNRVDGPEIHFLFRPRSIGMTGYLLVAHNDFRGSGEVKFALGDEDDGGPDGSTWTILAARNIVLGGEDEDDGEGFDFDIDARIRGADIVARNNLAAFGNEGFEVDRDFLGVQVINNTAAFTGRGEDDYSFGVSETDGAQAPVYFHNNLSHGNWRGVDRRVIASYTFLENHPDAAGYGSILSPDPVFMRHGTIFTPNFWFALGASSAAIDRGDPDSDFNDPDGSRNDMGAFGGPGAGTLGVLSSPSDPCPFLMVGVGPLLDLHAGAELIETEDVDEIRLVFNADVDSSTVGTATLPFEINGVAVAGSYTTDGRVVAFAPTSELPRDSEIRIVANTGLRNSSGQSLDFRHTRWFATKPSSSTLDSEPNNTVNEAQTLGGVRLARVLGGLGQGEPLDASDVFSISGFAGSRLQASLFAERIGSPAIDMGLRLYDTDGTTVLFENFFALQANDPFIDFTLPRNGTYYIEVFDESGSGQDPSSSYQLEIWRRDR